jgi:hypothetical protein
MKNFDSPKGNKTRRHFSLELTHVLPVWNHPKIVGVAQALLPVRFSGKCKLLLDPQLGLDCDPGERAPKQIAFCEVTFVAAPS